MDLDRLKDGTILAVALCYGFALAMAQTAGLLGIALLCMISLSVCRYAYEVLKTVAQGRAMIPAPGIETMNPFGDFRLVLHFALFIALIVLFQQPRVFGDGALAPVVRFGGLAAALSAFPASAGLMALTYDPATALNPKAVVDLVRVLGRRYLLLLGFGAALLVLSQWVGALPVPVLRTLLSRTVDVWAVLAVFALTGAAMRRRRDVIDIPGESVPEAEWRQRQKLADWRAQMDLAYASIRSGLTQQGYRTIRGLLEQEAMSAEAEQWVLDEMVRWEDKTHAAAFAASFVERLLARDESHRALEIAARLRGIAGGLALDRESVETLAAYARSLGREGLADDLLDRAGPRRALP